MTKSPAQCSNRFITRRDIISLAVTLGFVASIPLFIMLAVSNSAADRTGSGIELSAKGQPLQAMNSKPLLIATTKVGGW